MADREPTRDELTAVARQVWGEMNRALSRRDEIRFGKNGSKSVRLDKLTWYDHETGEGGGYVELYRIAGEPLPNGHDTAASAAPEIVYPYRDETGTLLFEVVRFPGHKFRQRQPDGTWSIKGVRRVPYRLPELVAADADEFVYLAEGEKDVDNIRKLGCIATCNPGGAEKWHSDYNSFLKDRHCVLLPDNDDPGRAHVQQVSRSLNGIAASIVVLELPGLGLKEDVSDWIARGGDRVQLEDLVRQVPVPPTPAGGLIATGAAFIAGAVAPEWLIDGIVQQGRLYACTSLTSHGKTAVWLYNGTMIQAGMRIAGLEVTKGNVLYLAGENPEDLRLRMLGMHLDLSLKRTNLPYVLPGAFPLDQDGVDHLRQEIAKVGIDFTLIIGDTAASFFPGDDENDNVMAGAYARSLRTLTEVAGNPAVVALCHPVKNAGRDNLLPRGGSAFLNEIDGNLALWSDEVGEMTTLSYQGKIRGPAFSPFSYRLRPVPTGLVDRRGRPIDTIIAEPMDDHEAVNRQRQNVSNEDAVLKTLKANPDWSWAEIANFIGWTKDAKPERWKVQRALQALEKARLVKSFRSKWQLTEAGEKYLKDSE